MGTSKIEVLMSPGTINKFK